MVLYPLIAAIIVVFAQLAHTYANIFKEPDKAVEHLLRYKRFCYFWSILLIVAAFVGHYWYSLPALL